MAREPTACGRRSHEAAASRAERLKHLDIEQENARWPAQRRSDVPRILFELS
jgi:hypothetical protein